MKKIAFIVFYILISVQAKAQFIQEKYTDVSIGLGMSAPYEEMNVFRSPGFYAMGDYVLSVNNWFDIRPYAGFILTKLIEDNSDEVKPRYSSEANAILLGGKFRITAPVSWVAPYFETGVGASIGSFSTFTPQTSIDKSGLIAHIPFSLGVELGPRNNVNLGFTYFFQNNLEQFMGAAVIGVSFPVGYY